MLKMTTTHAVGENEHRSGWPYVLNCLKPILSDDAPVLLEDFIERTFLYNRKTIVPPVFEKPWVGIMHHPPDMPDWYMPEMHIQEFYSHLQLQRSRKNLRLLITLGDNLTHWLKQVFPEIPVVTGYHPTGRPMLYWTPERFEAKRFPLLIQVGWFLRNQTGIYHLPKVPLTKAHLRTMNPAALRMLETCREKMAELRPECVWDEKVMQINNQPDAWYDILLAENVVFVELLSAVANNTVVECIARHTPIVVNRHPGPVHYLGEDYPLYYDKLEEVPDLLTKDRIIAAHEYIKNMDKWWIRGPMFTEFIRSACVQHVPELAGYPLPTNDDNRCFF